MARYISALVTIYASDIVKSALFYGGTLGLTETYRFPKIGAPEHMEFNGGNATIAVSSPAGLISHGMPQATPGHPFEIGMKTDDVDAAIHQLRSAGVLIIKEPSLSAAGNKYAYVADPDGTWISLYQTAPSTDA